MKKASVNVGSAEKLAGGGGNRKKSTTSVNFRNSVDNSRKGSAGGRRKSSVGANNVGKRKSSAGVATSPRRSSVSINQGKVKSPKGNQKRKGSTASKRKNKAQENKKKGSFVKKGSMLKSDSSESHIVLATGETVVKPIEPTFKRQEHGTMTSHPGRKSLEIIRYNRESQPVYVTSKHKNLERYEAWEKKKKGKRTNKRFLDVDPTEERRSDTTITYAEKDLVKLYIPHEASYKISELEDQSLATILGIHVFDNVEILWVEKAQTGDQALVASSIFEYDVYDESEQRIIVCYPEFKVEEDRLDDLTQPQQVTAQENDIPESFTCQLVVGKTVCRVNYYSEDNPVKTSCNQKAARIISLEMFDKKSKRIGRAVQESSSIHVKNILDETLMWIEQVPQVHGGFCVSKQKAFRCSVFIKLRNDQKKLFGHLGRNGKSVPKKDHHGPPLSFYFQAIPQPPVMGPDSSLYKMYVLGVLVGLTTCYVESKIQR